MHARDWEFRYRFPIIAALFIAAFMIRPDAPRTALLIIHGLGGGWITAHLVLGAAAVCVVAAAAVRTWAAAYLRTAVVHDTRFHSDKLVADGPYRHVRNPLYLGTLLIAVGLGVWTSLPGFVLLMTLLPLHLMRLILREELELERSGAESYRAFCAAVPRLLPSLAPRVPASGATPVWSQAFWGEMFVWGFAAASVTWAVTSRYRYGLVFIWIALAVRVLQRLLRGLASRPAVR